MPIRLLCAQPVVGVPLELFVPQRRGGGAAALSPRSVASSLSRSPSMEEASFLAGIDDVIEAEDGEETEGGTIGGSGGAGVGAPLGQVAAATMASSASSTSTPIIRWQRSPRGRPAHGDQGRGGRVCAYCGAAEGSLTLEAEVVRKHRNALQGFGQYCSALCLRAAWPRLRDLQAWVSALEQHGLHIEDLLDGQGGAGRPPTAPGAAARGAAEGGGKLQELAAAGPVILSGPGGARNQWQAVGVGRRYTPTIADIGRRLEASCEGETARTLLVLPPPPPAPPRQLLPLECDQLSMAPRHAAPLRVSVARSATRCERLAALAISWRARHRCCPARRGFTDPPVSGRSYNVLAELYAGERNGRPPRSTEKTAPRSTDRNRCEQPRTRTPTAPRPSPTGSSASGCCCASCLTSRRSRPPARQRRGRRRRSTRLAGPRLSAMETSPMCCVRRRRRRRRRLRPAGRAAAAAARGGAPSLAAGLEMAQLRGRGSSPRRGPSRGRGTWGGGRAPGVSILASVHID
jgi:hypothetical protein